MYEMLYKSTILVNYIFWHFKANFMEETVQGSSNYLKTKCWNDGLFLIDSLILASKVEDLESSVEQLSIVINDTEACLQEAQQRASALEFELAKKDAHLENLAKDTRVKAEAAIRAQKVTLSFNDLNKGKTLLYFGQEKFRILKNA